MDTGTAMLLTGGISAVGHWAEGKKLSINIVVGAGVAAIFLAAFASSNEEFASKLGLLILVTALFRYGVPIAKKLGYTA